MLPAAARPPYSVAVCHGRFHQAGARRRPRAGLHCAIRTSPRRFALFIGIDVGSRFLDAAATEAAALPPRVANTPEGIAALVAALHHDELRHATVAEPDLARVRAVVGSRDGLVARRTPWRNQRHHAQWAAEATVVAWLEGELADVERRLAAVAATSAALLATRPEAPVLLAQAGVGVLTAAAVLASLPAGVLGNPKAAAAYAGVHPRPEQSGQRSTSRLSKQGCPPLRRYLYLAAMAAVRFDPERKTCDERLCARGKAAPCALWAVAHKPRRRLMARIRDLPAREDPALPLAA